MSKAELDERVRAVRQFSRFYTRKIGVLRDGLLGSPLSLTEGRVLYELAQREPVTASDIAGELALDAGYLSRILGGFDRQGLIEKRTSDRDNRQVILVLTDRGREMFAAINARSRDEIAAMLGRLSNPEQARLVAALETAERLLGDRRKTGEPSYMLRPHQPGDMGWIIHRHRVLYAEEYGLDESFEAMVARRRDLHREFRHSEGALLDRRAGWRSRRLGTARQGRRRNCQTAASLRRAESTRPRDREPSCQRMHWLRPASRLSQNYAVDERCADLRPPHLSGGRL